MSLVFVERALRYARLRALMSCLISRFTQGLSEGLIRTSFEGTYLLMMELSVSVNFWVKMSILGSKRSNCLNKIINTFLAKQLMKRTGW